MIKSRTEGWRENNIGAVLDEFGLGAQDAVDGHEERRLVCLPVPRLPLLVGLREKQPTGYEPFERER